MDYLGTTRVAASNAARIELTSVGCALDHDELFDGIAFDTKNSPSAPS